MNERLLFLSIQLWQLNVNFVKFDPEVNFLSIFVKFDPGCQKRQVFLSLTFPVFISRTVPYPTATRQRDTPLSKRRTSSRRTNSWTLSKMTMTSKVRRALADVESMKIVVDQEKWRLPCNRAPLRRHSEEKQNEIRKQVDALLKLGVVKKLQATEWSQVQLVPKPTPKGMALHSQLCETQFSHRSTTYS